MRTIGRIIVGGFVFRRGQLLLGHNRSGGVYSGLWTVPGGGVDGDETLVQALRREMLEEIGITVSHAVPFGMSTGRSVKTLKDGEIVDVEMEFHDFLIRSDEEIVLGDDLVDYQWFDLDQLGSLEVSPGVREALKRLCLV